MDYSQMDALFTDHSSSNNNGHDLSSSFAEEYRARASQRVRNASLVSFADEIDSYDSMTSASALVSPDWSMTSSHPLQHSPPASVLFSEQYPSLVSPLNQDQSSMSVADGDNNNVSIAESLQSPGVFGTSADWGQPQHVQQLQQRLIQMSQLHQQLQLPLPLPHMVHPSDFTRYATEFPSMLPPRSFPVAAALTVREAAPRPRPPARVANDAQQQRQVPSLMGQHPGMFYGNQNEPAAHRARPSSNGSRRNSNSDSSACSSRGSSGSRFPADCSYCLSVGQDPSGHNKYNCPRLASLPPCRICNAEGKDNHTESHCPAMEKVELAYIPKKDRRRNRTI